MCPFSGDRSCHSNNDWHATWSRFQERNVCTSQGHIWRLQMVNISIIILQWHAKSQTLNKIYVWYQVLLLPTVTSNNAETVPMLTKESAETWWGEVVVRLVVTWLEWQPTVPLLFCKDTPLLQRALQTRREESGHSRLPE